MSIYKTAFRQFFPKTKPKAYLSSVNKDRKISEMSQGKRKFSRFREFEKIFVYPLDKSEAMCYNYKVVKRECAGIGRQASLRC